VCACCSRATISLVHRPSSAGPVAERCIARLRSCSRVAPCASSALRRRFGDLGHLRTSWTESTWPSAWSVCLYVWMSGESGQSGDGMWRPRRGRRRGRLGVVTNAAHGVTSVAMIGSGPRAQHDLLRAATSPSTDARSTARCARACTSLFAPSLRPGRAVGAVRAWTRGTPSARDQQAWMATASFPRRCASVPLLRAASPGLVWSRAIAVVTSRAAPVGSDLDRADRRVDAGLNQAAGARIWGS
jgi:hypothetical protein